MNRKAVTGWVFWIFIIFSLLPVFADGAKRSAQAVSIPRPGEGWDFPKIDIIKLNGEIIDDDNLQFTVDLKVDIERPGSFPLLAGDICEQDSSLKIRGSGWFWAGGEARLRYADKCYFLDCKDPGKLELSFTFSSRIEKDGNWRRSGFYMLPAIAREIMIKSPRRDIELEIPGAMALEKIDTDNGGASFSALISPEGNFTMQWRAHVEDVDADLVVSVSPNIIAEVMPGTVRIDGLFAYQVIQGKLSGMQFAVPEDLNILNVRGENIQDWTLSEENGETMLLVNLSRDYEDSYMLQLDAEKILPDFPCDFEVPVISPRNILRVDGYLAFGTSKAIKLIIEDISGLSQTDIRTFPVIADPATRRARQMPSRSAFVYRFSAPEYSCRTRADNIMPSFSAEISQVVNFTDEELAVKAICNLDIKDAPLRELLISYDAGLMVNRVEGPAVVPDDYELFEKGGVRYLRIPFRPDNIGKTAVFIYFEKNIKEMQEIQIPRFSLDLVKNVRGYLLLAAGRGINLQTSKLENLRQIYTGSAPIREPGLQLAYRFRDQDWSGEVRLQREKAVVMAEACHLGSIGEGTLYGSTVFSTHIAGAPLGQFVISVNAKAKNLEFTGRDIIDWKQLEEKDGIQLWQVNLREKIFGDYTLLVSYETKLEGEDAVCRFGDVSLTDADSETGFIILSSVRNLRISDTESTPGVLDIDSAEIPQEYRLMVHNPILKAFRFTRTSQWVDLTIKSFADQPLLDVAVDHLLLQSRIDRSGETVTQAEYRIKNASQQFLRMTLPEKAKLWSVEVNDELRRVSESEDKGVYLVPLPRNRDSNEAISVFVEYAQDFGELDTYRDIPLRAPSLNLEAMASRWIVRIPPDFHFLRLDGNMSTDQRPQLIGMPGLFSRFIKWGKAQMRPSFLSAWLCLALGGMVLAWSWGHKRMRVFLSLLGILVLVAGLFLGLVGLSQILRWELLEELRPVPVTTGEFTKLFSLPKDVLQLNLTVADMSGFSWLRLLKSLVLFGSGGILCAIAFWKTAGKQRLWLMAFGLSAILWAASQWLVPGSLLAFALAFLIPLVLLLAFWARIFRHARQRALLAMMLFALFPLGLSAADIMVEEINYEVTVGESAVSTVADYRIEAASPGRILVVAAPGALVGEIPKDDRLEIIREGRDYWMLIKNKGDYQFKLSFLLPLEDAGSSEYRFYLDMPSCRRNRADFKIDRKNKNFAVEATNAVSFTGRIRAGEFTAEGTFVPGSRTYFRVHPQKRNIGKEKLVFFVKNDAMARFSAGFVEVANRVSIQIAQGELSRLIASIPENMRVTAVEAPALGAWRYDPLTQRLEAFFTEPQHGNLDLNITTQIANCNLPYTLPVGLPDFVDAGRQHGSIGLAPEETVQVLVEKSDGFNKINPEDVAPIFRRSVDSIKRAFRYQGSPQQILVKATPVEPELRIYENTVVSFGEERTRLVADLELDIAKAGIFQLAVELPERFDIDRLSGAEIRHWDEIAEPGKHQALIHFESRLIGKAKLHIELSMMEKKAEHERVIPRIAIADARKHKGQIEIQLEQGMRIEILDRRGLEILTGGWKRSGGAASHRFGIVRPDWQLKLAFETAKPWIQVDELQIVKLAEGIMERECHFRYTIENTGVKRFRIQLPQGAEGTDFTGRNIVGTQQMDDGSWEVELHQKITGIYPLMIRFRQSWESGSNVTILPVAAVNVEMQKGYCAVLAGDSLAVKAGEKTGEISDFDPRRIPDDFKVDYLSNAVLCYRTVSSNYQLELNVVRHKAARLLPARVESVEMNSTVSRDGRLITRVKVELQNGNETFLRMQLPPGSSIWSVLIDQQPVEIAREGERILIPLRQAMSGTRDQSIEFDYSQPQNPEWTKTSQAYHGPIFDTSLRNINWNLYLPDDCRYEDFSGTLDYMDSSFIGRLTVDIDEYDRKSMAYNVENRRVAQQWLSKANTLAQSGRQEEAFDAFQNAANLSFNDKELNADIQGQWIASQRGSSIAAFANRRGGKRKREKIDISGENLPQQEVQQIQLDQARVKQLEQELGGVELRHLRAISDKIFLQQQAAASVTHPLILNIPQGGKLLRFHRPLQVKADAPLEVRFSAEPAFRLKNYSAILAFAAFAGIFAVLFAIARKTGFRYAAAAPCLRGSDSCPN